MKIRTRLTLWFSALLLLLTSAGAILGWLGIRQHLLKLAETELLAKQQEVRMLLESLDEWQDQTALKVQPRARLLEHVFAEEQTLLYHQIFVQVHDVEGQLIVSSPSLGAAKMPLRAEVPLRHWLELPGGGQWVLCLSTPLLLQGQQQGWLQMGLALDKIDVLLWQLARYELMGILLALLSALVLGRFLADRALLPMVKVSTEVQQMIRGEPLHLLDTQALKQDEIGELVKTFNDLLAQIQGVFTAQQRFIADASHEFKTPLTAIRGHAQLIERHGEHSERRLKSATSIIRQTRRLGRLVDDLLLLSRLESLGFLLHPLNLVDLVTETYDDLKPLYPCLSLHIETPVLMIAGNGDALCRVLTNLLDNAFAAVQGAPVQQVQIICRRADRWAELRIEDRGTGIGPEHVPHLFERFYRVNADRARHTEGSGIGLALVQEMVHLHRGQIQVSSVPAQGTCFTLLFPLEPQLEN